MVGTSNLGSWNGHWFNGISSNQDLWCYSLLQFATLCSWNMASKEFMYPVLLNGNKNPYISSYENVCQRINIYFPMVFEWFSHFPMGFPMNFPFSYGFSWDFPIFPWVFLWVFHKKERCQSQRKIAGATETIWKNLFQAPTPNLIHAYEAHLWLVILYMYIYIYINE